MGTAEAKRAWALANPDKVRESNRKWREKNLERERAASLARFYANHEVRLAYGKEWARLNPEKVRESGRRHDVKPHRKKQQRGDFKARQARYRVNNLEKVRAMRRAYQALRRQDPVQRVIDAVRRRMRSVINGRSKGAFVEFGYTAEELRSHLAAQFREGMNWDNYGIYGEKWHVDHIRPVSSFKFPEELVACFALENLQPLWAIENLTKSAKMGGCYSVEYAQP